jgi:hypothetical protein
VPARVPGTASVQPALSFKWYAFKWYAFKWFAAHRLAKSLVTSALAITAALAVLSLPAAAARAAEDARPIVASAPARSCAVAGEQILAANILRRAVYQEQFSHYSPRRGRCYVEMRVEVMESDEDADRFGRFLYDGDTKELLAYAEIKGGTKSGRVFDLDHRTTTFANSGWDDASGYIYQMMADDR